MPTVVVHAASQAAMYAHHWRDISTLLKRPIAKRAKTPAELNWLDEQRIKIWTDLALYKSDEGTERLRRLDVLAKRIVGLT